MFVLLHRPHQILNVALVKETVFSANGWKQFWSKNNPGMICLWVSFFFSFLFFCDTLFPSEFHFTSRIQLDLFWLLLCLKGERLTPCYRTGAEPGHRQEEEPHQPFWHACLCFNKDDARARALSERSCATCSSSFPSCFQVFAAVWADCAGEGRQEIRKQQ